MMLLAATAVLNCAMVPTEAPARKALGATRLAMNLVLDPSTARSIAAGETKPMPIRFVGQTAPGSGWIVHNAYDPQAPEIMLGRVTRSESGLQMAWGKATRNGTAYDWSQTMQGTCALTGEEVLK